MTKYDWVSLAVLLFVAWSLYRLFSPTVVRFMLH